MKTPRILLRDSLRRTLFFFGPRVITLYLVLFLLGGMVVNYRKGSYHARLAAVSRLMPSDFEYLFTIEGKKPDEIDRLRLKEYERFFEELLEIYPGATDVQGLLGFCRYYLGKDKKAFEAYQGATRGMKQFFSFQYNLGALYFKRGQYQPAFGAFREALETDMLQNINHLIRSLAFLTILRDRISGGRSEDLFGKIKTSYRHCYTLVIISCYYLKKFPEMLFYSLKAVDANLDKDGTFYYFAGWAQYEMQDYQRALALFEMTNQINSDNDAAYRGAALCLLALGNNAEAEKILQKADLVAKTKGAVKPFEPAITIVVF